MANTPRRSADTPSRRRTVTLRAGVSVGPYKVVELVGAGGMGEVYRAVDERLGRTVAVKTIRTSASGDAEATQRLIGEARTAAALNHPNIAHIHDIGTWRGITYIVMEFVEGMSLEARLAAGPLPPEEILPYAKSIASALGEAHRRGIIHRDIKPANILVSPAGDVKILDFGIAKLVPSGSSGSDAGITSTGILVGTASYMSPEQALGERIGFAADVFSAGVVLYRMATGVLPFEGASVFQTVDRILHAEPAPISRPDLPPQLQRVIRQALEKNPAARFPDGGALEAALTAIQTGNASRSGRIPIAVLPFDDLSPDEENRYFSTGLADEITAALSKIKGLAVVSRSAASRYKASGQDARAIAAQLNLRYVLDGSVRKVRDTLRITAELIDAEKDLNVWAETYTGKLHNVFDIQEEVARKIVSALTVNLSSAEKVTLGTRATDNAAAFDLYLRARHHSSVATKRDLQIALALFEQALILDERYAAAHAGIAEAAAAFYEYYERSEAWLDTAVESALKSLMYDASLAEAYAALGLAYFNKGRLDESRTACTRAIELDPENWIGYWTLGRIHYVTGRTDDAIELLQRAIALNPDFYVAYFTLRMVCQADGRDEVYRAYLTRLLEDVFPRYLARNPTDARALNSYGMELSMAGRVDEGRAHVDRALALDPQDPMVLYATACYYSRFGDRDKAVDLLERAVAAGFANIEYMERDPDLRPLHHEPRYRGLVSRRS